MPDPRQFDLVIRSAITGAIALIIIVVVSIYFGSHTSLNGSAVRAARDQQMTAQLLGANRAPEPGEVTTTTTTAGHEPPL